MGHLCELNNNSSFKRSFWRFACLLGLSVLSGSCSVKVCGAGLNIPGSTQGLSPQSPIYCSETCTGQEPRSCNGLSL